MRYTTRETYIIRVSVRPDLEMQPSTSIRRFGHTIGSIESSNLGTLESDALSRKYKGRDQT